IGLDEIVIEHVQVVSVDVDGGSATVRVAFGCAVSGNANGVVEIGDGIAGDHVARAINFHGIVTGETVGAVGGYWPRAAAGLARDAAPSDQAEAVVAAKKEIVRNVEIARARILGPDAKTDIFKAAILDRKPDGAEDLFLAGENG